MKRFFALLAIIALPIAALAQDAVVTFTGLPPVQGVDLAVGVNLVGFDPIPAGTTSHQLLKSIGEETTISSIRRFNTDTGRFETAAYHDGVPVGPDFPIERGAAYLAS